MNCAIVRQRLLGSERPDKPGPEESRHLATCATCHAWLRRLVRLERKIAELHVPACSVPSTLLEQINEPATTSRAKAPQPPGPLVRPPLQPSAEMRSVREVGRQKLALAFSLAATLALFTLAWWAWPPRPPEKTVEGPSVSQYQTRLRNSLLPARTPQERIEVLAALADEFLAEARASADNPAQIAVLAGDYERLVQTDLFEEARAVPAPDRPRVLYPIARRMQEAEKAALELAASWDTRHAEAAKSLRAIAASAREADRRLRRLVQTRAGTTMSQAHRA
jgi:hypothetical protein